MHLTVQAELNLARVKSRGGHLVLFGGEDVLGNDLHRVILQVGLRSCVVFVCTEDIPGTGSFCQRTISGTVPKRNIRRKENNANGDNLEEGGRTVSCMS